MTINTEHIGLKYASFLNNATLEAEPVKRDVEALVAEVERVRELARVADRRAYRAEQLLQRDDLGAQLVAMARTAAQWQKNAEIEHKEVVRLQGRADFLADELAETKGNLQVVTDSADRWMAKSEENFQAAKRSVADLDLKCSEVTRLLANVTEARQLLLYCAMPHGLYEARIQDYEHWIADLETKVAKWKKRAEKMQGMSFEIIRGLGEKTEGRIWRDGVLVFDGVAHQKEHGWRT